MAGNLDVLLGRLALGPLLRLRLDRLILPPPPFTSEHRLRRVLDELLLDVSFSNAKSGSHVLDRRLDVDLTADESFLISSVVDFDRLTDVDLLEVSVIVDFGSVVLERCRDPRLLTVDDFFVGMSATDRLC